MQGAWVQSLVKELRYYMSQGQKKQNMKQFGFVLIQPPKLLLVNDIRKGTLSVSGKLCTYLSVRQVNDE